MEDSEQIDLIDFSSENDNLIFSLSSPPPADFEQKFSENQKDPKSFQMFGDMDAGKEDVTQDNDPTEQVPELAESEEPQTTRRTGKCNLRKSLAWDSAFFTNAGVLDPEELSSIITGTGKREKHCLPGIQEDIRISSDSVSTLESDSLTLESLETELFEDIRASIQKSCKAVKSSCGNTAFEEPGKKAISSSKGDLASGNQLKRKPVMKRATGLQAIGIPKCQPKMSTGMQGSGKTIKPQSVCSQAHKSTLRIRESASSVPKPPKEISKVNSNVPAMTQGASLGTSRVKTDNDNARTGRGIQPLKAPVPSGARRVLPKPSSSSSLAPSTISKTQSTRSPKGDNSGSTSSGDGVKSSLAVDRKKVATRMLNPPSSSSTSKTPSRSALKSKSTSRNATLSAHLMSSKISSNISPASSIGEWSSASSSSSVTHMSNKSRTSVDSSSHRSLEIDAPSLDLKTHLDNQLPDGQQNQEIILPGEKVRKSSLQNGTVARSSSMKPSGLRMPSPKIGFFDGVKSVRTPNGTLQSHSNLPVALSKTGAGISSKSRKLPPGRVVTALANIKPEVEKPNSPSFLQENPKASSNLDVHDEKVVESCLKYVEVGGEERDEAKYVGDAGFGAIVNHILDAPKNEMSLDRNGDPPKNEMSLDRNGDPPTDVPVDGESNDSNLISSPSINASRTLDNNVADGQHHFISNLQSHCKIDEKENVHRGDQLDGINKHGVGVVKSDINCQIVESLRNSEPNSMTFFQTTSEISASRTPLSVKNSLCHSASVGFPNVSADQVLEKAIVDLPHLEGEDKESIK